MAKYRFADAIEVKPNERAKLAKVEAFLWQGKVDDAIVQFNHWQDEQAKNFF